MKSGYLERQQRLVQANRDLVESIIKQLALDTLQCALHDEGWGYKRISEFTQKWGAKFRTYYPALTGYVEADYLRFCLDRELRDIVKDHQEFHEFHERYPEIKEITYGGKK